MKKIIIKKMAYLDLMQIKDYISMDSIYYARKTIADIKNKIEVLKLFPKVGRKIPEYNLEDLREIFFKAYRIQYTFDSENIYILRVFHHSKNIF